jgi:hypothetical protein
MANTNVDFMIDDLLHRVKSMGYAEDLSKLYALEEELVNLENYIHDAKERLSIVVSLFKEAGKTQHILSSVAKAFDGETKKAENAWTSYWGAVQQQCDGDNFEMKSVGE